MVFLPVGTSKKRMDRGGIAPANEMLQFSIISPAVGTIAAVDWRGFGMLRWQLAGRLHYFAVRVEGGRRKLGSAHGDEG